MQNIKRLCLLFVALMVVVVTIIIINQPGKSLAVDNPDYIAIENALQSYLEIDAKLRRGSPRAFLFVGLTFGP